MSEELLRAVNHRRKHDFTLKILIRVICLNDINIQHGVDHLARLTPPWIVRLENMKLAVLDLKIFWVSTHIQKCTLSPTDDVLSNIHWWTTWIDMTLFVHEVLDCLVWCENYANSSTKHQWVNRAILLGPFLILQPCIFLRYLMKIPKNRNGWWARGNSLGPTTNLQEAVKTIRQQYTPYDQCYLGEGRCFKKGCHDAFGRTCLEEFETIENNFWLNSQQTTTELHVQKLAWYWVKVLMNRTTILQQSQTSYIIFEYELSAC